MIPTDPNQERVALEVGRWLGCPPRYALVRDLRQFAALSLDEAFACTTRVLNGETIYLEAPGAHAAETLAAATWKYGVMTRLKSDAATSFRPRRTVSLEERRGVQHLIDVFEDAEVPYRLVAPEETLEWAAWLGQSFPMTGWGLIDWGAVAAECWTSVSTSEIAAHVATIASKRPQVQPVVRIMERVVSPGVECRMLLTLPHLQSIVEALGEGWVLCLESGWALEGYGASVVRIGYRFDG